MNKNLLFIIAVALFSLLSVRVNAQGSVPYFTGGATQSLSVCQNASATPINSLLAVIDSDTAETETWAAVTAPAHGTLSASYTTTSTGGTLTPSGLIFTPTSGFSGADTFSVEVSDGALMDTIIFFVTVRPLPSAGTISGPSSVCVGSSITLTSSATGGSWSSSNATANITGAGLVTGLAAGIDTITYFVVNSCGVAYAYTSITINPLAHAGTITGPSAVCVGASIMVANTTTGGTWAITNSNATLATDTVTGVTPGADTVTYTLTTVCGTDVAIHPITINPLPVAGSITGATVVCEGATITDTASATGGSWSATNGNATVAGGVITGVAAGMDTIIYAVTNSCGTATAIQVITINPLPVVGAISGPSGVCVGASITLSETVSGGTWSRTNTAASIADSVVTGVTPGIDTILYSLTNGCGTRSASHVVTITGAPAAGPITGPDRVCRGSSITLSAPVSGTWTALNGNTSVSGSVVTGVAYGRDTITNIASNSCGADTAFHVVRVDTVAPTVSLIAGPYIVCVNDTITVMDSVAGGRWGVTNSHASINSTGRIRGNSAGVDTVLYILTNGCGADTADYPVTVNPLPYAGVIRGYDSVCKNSTILLTDTTAGGSWESSNAFYASVDTAGHVRGSQRGSVNIYYIVSNSCGSDTATKHIDVNIPAGAIIGSPTLCQGATSILLDVTPGGTWSTPITSWLVIGPVIGGTVIGLTTGTATVTYTMRNACGTTTATFDIEVVVCDSPASVAEVKGHNNDIGIYPNPGKGLFTINLPFSTGDNALVDVTDMLGRKVKTMSLPGNAATEVALDIPAGVYIISASVKDKKYTTRVVVTE